MPDTDTRVFAKSARDEYAQQAAAYDAQRSWALSEARRLA